MKKLRVLDLFSGIGGFSLGLERTGGFETVAFCEIDPFCRKVLAKHWPNVRQYEDVRELTADALRRDGIAVDVICGGFPCQDISTAGRGAGLDGERSGLWSEIVRLAGEIRPGYIIVENVAALLGRGLDRVLGDLAEVGYDAEWHCIPASAVGAPHRRDRIWIVADARHARVHQRWVPPHVERQSQEPRRMVVDGPPKGEVGEGEALAHAISERQSGQGQSIVSGSQAPRLDWQTIDAFAGRVGGIWRTEPNVGRVAHGVPQRMDRLKGLGNAVVPQIPEIIGHAILQSLEEPA